MNWRGLVIKIFGTNYGETERYLSEKLSKEDFIVLKYCLVRLWRDYGGLFTSDEDGRVCHEMIICVFSKNAPSIEKLFTKKEAEVILKAEALLNKAPEKVHKELFKHFGF